MLVSTKKTRWPMVPRYQVQDTLGPWNLSPVHVPLSCHSRGIACRDIDQGPYNTRQSRPCLHGGPPSTSGVEPTPRDLSDASFCSLSPCQADRFQEASVARASNECRGAGDLKVQSISNSAADVPVESLPCPCCHSESQLL
jgi:hypothetical protein